MKSFIRPSSFVLRPSERGFTLIELMIVMTVIGVASGVGVAAFSRSITSKRLETGAWSFGAVMSRARSLAVQSGTPHRLRLDLERGVYWVEAWRPGPEGEEGNFKPLGRDLGRPNMLPDRVHVERMIPLFDLPQVAFDSRGRVEGPIHVLIANQKGELWTVAMSPANGRLYVLRGDVNPFDPAGRPELAMDGASTDLPPAVAESVP